MAEDKVYKLMYFDCVGLGEGIRYILHANNQEFEDYRIEISEADHETFKLRYGPEWEELKPSKILLLFLLTLFMIAIFTFSVFTPS